MPRIPAVNRNVSAPAARTPNSAVTVNVAVPAKKAAGLRRRLNGWNLAVLPSHTPDVVELDPLNEQAVVHPSTWSNIKNDPAAMAVLIHEQSEAVRLMQTRMVDVSPFTPQSKLAKPRVEPKADGIKKLTTDLTLLVQELSGMDPADTGAVAAAAARYGKYRDVMADLRTAFASAEASFELAQDLLVAKLGDE